jgi:CheY-like chemotaxis protein
MATVLVADDEAPVLEFYRVLLRNEGYAILEAADAPTAVKLATQNRPDLIIMDWMMPGVDGMDALRILKSYASTRDIPVVMATALDGLSDIRLATDAGADGYLVKPIEPDDLLALIRRFIAPAPPPP